MTIDAATNILTQDDIIQGLQDEVVEDMSSLQDYLEASGSDTSLDEIQITNMGKGLLARTPFSSVSGKVNLNKGFARIDQSLSIILHTLEEEVPMLPILGSKAESLLFEPADEVMFDAMEELLKEKVAVLEPRIVLLEVTMDDSEVDKNKVGVTMLYRLTNTNIVREFRDTIVSDKGGDVL